MEASGARQTPSAYPWSELGVLSLAFLNMQPESGRQAVTQTWVHTEM